MKRFKRDQVQQPKKTQTKQKKKRVITPRRPIRNAALLAKQAYLSSTTYRTTTNSGHAKQQKELRNEREELLLLLDNQQQLHESQHSVLQQGGHLLSTSGEVVEHFDDIPLNTASTNDKKNNNNKYKHLLQTRVKTFSIFSGLTDEIQNTADDSKINEISSTNNTTVINKIRRRKRFNPLDSTLFISLLSFFTRLPSHRIDEQQFTSIHNDIGNNNNNNTVNNIGINNYGDNTINNNNNGIIPSYHHRLQRDLSTQYQHYKLEDIVTDTNDDHKNLNNALNLLDLLQNTALSHLSTESIHQIKNHIYTTHLRPARQKLHNIFSKLSDSTSSSSSLDINEGDNNNNTNNNIDTDIIQDFTKMSSEELQQQIALLKQRKPQRKQKLQSIFHPTLSQHWFKPFNYSATVPPEVPVSFKTTEKLQDQKMTAERLHDLYGSLGTRVYFAVTAFAMVSLWCILSTIPMFDPHHIVDVITDTQFFKYKISKQNQFEISRNLHQSTFTIKFITTYIVLRFLDPIRLAVSSTLARYVEEKRLFMNLQIRNIIETEPDPVKQYERIQMLLHYIRHEYGKHDQYQTLTVRELFDITDIQPIPDLHAFDDVRKPQKGIPPKHGLDYIGPNAGMNHMIRFFNRTGLPVGNIAKEGTKPIIKEYPDPDDPTRIEYIVVRMTRIDGAEIESIRSTSRNRTSVHIWKKPDPIEENGGNTFQHVHLRHPPGSKIWLRNKAKREYIRRHGKWAMFGFDDEHGPVFPEFRAAYEDFHQPMILPQTMYDKDDVEWYKYHRHPALNYGGTDATVNPIGYAARQKLIQEQEQLQKMKSDVLHPFHKMMIDDTLELAEHANAAATRLTEIDKYDAIQDEERAKEWLLKDIVEEPLDFTRYPETGRKPKTPTIEKLVDNMIPTDPHTGSRSGYIFRQDEAVKYHETNVYEFITNLEIEKAKRDTNNMNLTIVAPDGERLPLEPTALEKSMDNLMGIQSTPRETRRLFQFSQHYFDKLAQNDDSIKHQLDFLQYSINQQQEMLESEKALLAGNYYQSNNDNNNNNIQPSSTVLKHQYADPARVALQAEIAQRRDITIQQQLSPDLNIQEFQRMSASPIERQQFHNQEQQAFNASININAQRHRLAATNTWSTLNRPPLVVETTAIPTTVSNQQQNNNNNNDIFNQNTPIIKYPEPPQVYQEQIEAAKEDKLRNYYRDTLRSLLQKDVVAEKEQELKQKAKAQRDKLRKKRKGNNNDNIMDDDNNDNDDDEDIAPEDKDMALLNAKRPSDLELLNDIAKQPQKSLDNLENDYGLNPASNLTKNPQNSRQQQRIAKKYLNQKKYGLNDDDDSEEFDEEEAFFNSLNLKDFVNEYDPKFLEQIIKHKHYLQQQRALKEGRILPKNIAEKRKDALTATLLDDMEDDLLFNLNAENTLIANVKNKNPLLNDIKPDPNSLHSHDILVKPVELNQLRRGDTAEDRLPGELLTQNDLIRIVHFNPGRGETLDDLKRNLFEAKLQVQRNAYKYLEQVDKQKENDKLNNNTKNTTTVVDSNNIGGIGSGISGGASYAQQTQALSQLENGGIINNNNTIGQQNSTSPLNPSTSTSSSTTASHWIPKVLGAGEVGTSQEDENIAEMKRHGHPPVANAQDALHAHQQHQEQLDIGNTTPYGRVVNNNKQNQNNTNIVDVNVVSNTDVLDVDANGATITTTTRLPRYLHGDVVDHTNMDNTNSNNKENDNNNNQHDNVDPLLQKKDIQDYLAKQNRAQYEQGIGNVNTSTSTSTTATTKTTQFESFDNVRKENIKNNLNNIDDLNDTTTNNNISSPAILIDNTLLKAAKTRNQIDSLKLDDPRAKDKIKQDKRSSSVHLFDGGRDLEVIATNEKLIFTANRKGPLDSKNPTDEEDKKHNDYLIYTDDELNDSEDYEDENEHKTIQEIEEENYYRRQRGEAPIYTRKALARLLHDLETDVLLNEKGGKTGIENDEDLKDIKTHLQSLQRLEKQKARRRAHHKALLDGSLYHELDQIVDNEQKMYIKNKIFEYFYQDPFFALQNDIEFQSVVAAELQHAIDLKHPINIEIKVLSTTLTSSDDDNSSEQDNNNSFGKQSKIFHKIPSLNKIQYNIIKERREAELSPEEQLLRAMQRKEAWDSLGITGGKNKEKTTTKQDNNNNESKDEQQKLMNINNYKTPMMEDPILVKDVQFDDEKEPTTIDVLTGKALPTGVDPKVKDKIKKFQEKEQQPVEKTLAEELQLNQDDVDPYDIENNTLLTHQLEKEEEQKEKEHQALLQAHRLREQRRKDPKRNHWTAIPNHDPVAIYYGLDMELLNYNKIKNTTTTTSPVLQPQIGDVFNIGSLTPPQGTTKSVTMTDEHKIAHGLHSNANSISKRLPHGAILTPGHYHSQHPQIITAQQSIISSQIEDFKQTRIQSQQPSQQQQQQQSTVGTPYAVPTDGITPNVVHTPSGVPSAPGYNQPIQPILAQEMTTPDQLLPQIHPFQNFDITTKTQNNPKAIQQKSYISELLEPLTAESLMSPEAATYFDSLVNPEEHRKTVDTAIVNRVGAFEDYAKEHNIDPADPLHPVEVPLPLYVRFQIIQEELQELLQEDKETIAQRLKEEEEELQRIEKIAQERAQRRRQAIEAGEIEEHDDFDAYERQKKVEKDLEEFEQRKKKHAAVGLSTSVGLDTLSAVNNKGKGGKTKEQRAKDDYLEEFLAEGSQEQDHREENEEILRKKRNELTEEELWAKQREERKQYARTILYGTPEPVDIKTIKEPEKLVENFLEKKSGYTNIDEAISLRTIGNLEPMLDNHTDIRKQKEYIRQSILQQPWVKLLAKNPTKQKDNNTTTQSTTTDGTPEDVHDIDPAIVDQMYSKQRQKEYQIHIPGIDDLPEAGSWTEAERLDRIMQKYQEIQAFAERYRRETDNKDPNEEKGMDMRNIKGSKKETGGEKPPHEVYRETLERFPDAVLIATEASFYTKQGSAGQFHQSMALYSNTAEPGIFINHDDSDQKQADKYIEKIFDADIKAERAKWARQKLKPYLHKYQLESARIQKVQSGEMDREIHNDKILKILQKHPKWQKHVVLEPGSGYLYIMHPKRQDPNWHDKELEETFLSNPMYHFKGTLARFTELKDHTVKFITQSMYGLEKREHRRQLLAKKAQEKELLNDIQFQALKNIDDNPLQLPSDREEYLKRQAAASQQAIISQQIPRTDQFGNNNMMGTGLVGGGTSSQQLQAANNALTSFNALPSNAHKQLLLPPPTTLQQQQQQQGEVEENKYKIVQERAADRLRDLPVEFSTWRADRHVTINPLLPYDQQLIYQIQIQEQNQRIVNAEKDFNIVDNEKRFPHLAVQKARQHFWEDKTINRYNNEAFVTRHKLQGIVDAHNQQVDQEQKLIDDINNKYNNYLEDEERERIGKRLELHRKLLAQGRFNDAKMLFASPDTYKFKGLLEEKIKAQQGAGIQQNDQGPPNTNDPTQQIIDWKLLDSGQLAPSAVMNQDGDYGNDNGGTPPLAGNDIIKKPAYDKNFPWRWDLESDEELPTDPDWIDHEAPKIPDNKIFGALQTELKRPQRYPAKAWKVLNRTQKKLQIYTAMRDKLFPQIRSVQTGSLPLHVKPVTYHIDEPPQFNFPGFKRHFKQRSRKWKDPKRPKSGVVRRNRRARNAAKMAVWQEYVDKSWEWWLQTDVPYPKLSLMRDPFQRRLKINHDLPYDNHYFERAEAVRPFWTLDPAQLPKPRVPLNRINDPSHPELQKFHRRMRNLSLVEMMIIRQSLKLFWANRYIAKRRGARRTLANMRRDFAEYFIKNRIYQRDMKQWEREQHLMKIRQQAQYSGPGAAEDDLDDLLYTVDIQPIVPKTKEAPNFEYQYP